MDDALNAEAALEKITEGRHAKHIPGGQILLYEGDTPLEVFIVKQGVVKVYDIDEQGNEKVLHLLKAPALIPFAFFSNMHEPLKWFYVTLTDCDVYPIPAKELRDMIRQDWRLSEALTTQFSEDVHELLVRLSSMGKSNAREKVVAALKFLMVCHATERHSGWWRVNFSVNHQLIADICGITRESTALVMKDLQTEGVIRNPRITILEIHKEHLIVL